MLMNLKAHNSTEPKTSAVRTQNPSPGTVKETRAPRYVVHSKKTLPREEGQPTATRREWTRREPTSLPSRMNTSSHLKTGQGVKSRRRRLAWVVARTSTLRAGIKLQRSYKTLLFLKRTIWQWVKILRRRIRSASQLLFRIRGIRIGFWEQQIICTNRPTSLASSSLRTRSSIQSLIRWEPRSHCCRSRPSLWCMRTMTFQRSRGGSGEFRIEISLPWVRQARSISRTNLVLMKPTHSTQLLVQLLHHCRSGTKMRNCQS